ncbi:MAG: ABC transporter substrate-binding protein [archaeon]|nr:ABC transporter substrate-binding protein [archaeon]
MNEKNAIIAIAAVAVIVLASFCGFAMIKNNEGEKYEAKVTGNVPVLGNANNDDYVDSHDIDTLREIINSGSWDRETYPFADADRSGSIDEADIEIVQKIIDGERTPLYYKDIYGEFVKVSYPVKHERIGVSYWQQAEMATLIGQWDKVVLASQSTTSSNSHRYDVSNITKSFKGSSITTELILECQCDFVIASQGKSSVVNAAVDAAKSENGREITPYYVDVSKSASYVGAVLTLGVILNENKAAQNYAKYVYDILDKITEGMKKVDKKADSVVTLMYANQSTRANIIVECEGTGAADMIGLISNVYDDATKSTSDYRLNVEPDWFIQNSGKKFEYIIIQQEGTDTKKVDDTYYTPKMYNDRFEEAITYYSSTSAYSQGKILGTTFSYNSFGGYANLLYLAYLMYPDVFSEEDGWNALQIYFDNFTTAKIDVKTQGGWYYSGTAYAQYNQRLSS